MSNQLLQTVPIKDLKGTFVVASYQRGYRWDSLQVKRLLDDIFDFSRNCKSLQDKYFLQPIVVRSLGGEAEWELIDGQQRLTTILLIFVYLSKEILKNHEMGFTLRYKSRRDSMEYILDINEEQSQENIDFDYIYKAYCTIETWFKEHPDGASVIGVKFYGILLESVHVLRYEIADDAHIRSEELFTRLNMGKIPLTSAELIKAWLMSSNSDEDDSKIRETRNTEIGVQWDEIEHKLQDKNFWGFLTGEPAEKFPAHIDLLFEFLAKFIKSKEGRGGGSQKTSSHDPYHTFFYLTTIAYGGEATDAQKRRRDLWDGIRQMYQTLCFWYEDRDIYHLVGYLTHCGPTIEKLYQLNQELLKSVFRESIDVLVKATLEDCKDLDALRYDKNADKTLIHRILLLFNIESVREGGDDLYRYPFARHRSKQWTLEHIQPQSADNLVKKETQRAWLSAHKRVLENWSPGPDLSIENCDQQKNLLERVSKILQKNDLNYTDFESLSADIISFFNKDGDSNIHGLGNMTLLDAQDNSSLSNLVFAAKRQRILELDKEGAFIPIATRRLFLRYYDVDQQTVNSPYWEDKDQEQYLEAITQKLSTYLPKGENQ